MADEIKNLSSYTKIEGTKISYSRKDVLGSGTFGTVYLGIFEEKKVAIKKIQLKHAVKEDREVKNQLEAQGHENVVQIFETVQDLDFRYIAMELCAGTLGEVIEKKYKGPPLPPDDKVLYQMANGLHHIHSQKLIHRDIKPANVLISYAGRIKWSDFGISKQISTCDTCSMSSGLKGTHSWMAPEFCQIGNNESIKATPMSDVFPCGCLFFVFVTRKDGGIHPFGDTNDPITIQVNIRNDKQVNIDKLQPSHFAAPIIQKMIEHLPEKRIPLSEVKKLLKDHPSNVLRLARAKMEARGVRCVKFHPVYSTSVACVLYYGRVMLTVKQSQPSLPIKHPNKNLNASGFITCIKWNKFGTQLAAAGYTTVTVWDYPSGDLVLEYLINFVQGPEMIWNPFDPTLLAVYQTNSPDKVVILCTTAKQPLLKKLGTGSAYSCIEWISHNQLACGYDNGDIEIREMDREYTEGIVMKIFVRAHDETVRCVVWNEKLELLASCSGDGRIKIWSIDQPNPKKILSQYSNCRSLGWSPNENKVDRMNSAEGASVKTSSIARGFVIGDIEVSVTVEKCIETQYMEKHSAPVHQVLFSPNGAFLASNAFGKAFGVKGGVIIWYTETWEKIWRLEGTFWINSWDRTGFMLVITDQTNEETKSIKINTTRGQKRKRADSGKQLAIDV